MYPGEWTYRQLAAARDARLEHDWWHTANLLCQQANINRDKNSPRQDVYRFHPFAKKPPPRQATPEEIRRLFGDQ